MSAFGLFCGLMVALVISGFVGQQAQAWVIIGAACMVLGDLVVSLRPNADEIRTQPRTGVKTDG